MRLVTALLLAEFGGLAGKSRRLIVQGNDARRAQNRLAQPAHAEQQQQHPDGELQEMQRDVIQERAERDDDCRQQRKPANRAEPGRTPAANGGDGEHDRQRFHRLDQRSQECRS